MFRIILHLIEIKQHFLFTQLENAADFSRWLSTIEADGGLKPPSAPDTVKECSSLIGFTELVAGY